MEKERTVKTRGPRPSMPPDAVTHADLMVPGFRLMLPPCSEHPSDRGSSDSKVFSARSRAGPIEADRM